MKRSFVVLGFAMVGVSCGTTDNAADPDHPQCGNGAIDPGETCDGDELAGMTCAALGAPGGDLACSATCDGFDLSTCDAPASCGNGVLDAGEACDGDVLGGTCQSLGMGSGTLACRPNCLEHDTSGCDETVELGTHFDDAQSWSLPSAAFIREYGGAEMYGQESWSMFDIDGDGRPDLVATNHLVDDGFGPLVRPFGDSSNPHWRVYRNTGAGFAPAIQWLLPTIGGTIGVGFPYQGWNAYQNGDESWSTFDIDGDNRPDLVATNKRYGNGFVGVFGFDSTPHWRVYRNTGTGFASPTMWPLPPDGGLPGASFPMLSHDVQAVNEESWSLLDIDGDGRSDLVSTNKGYSGELIGVFGFDTTPHWRVYRNTGTGFASATMWLLPTTGGIPGGSFPTLSLDAAALDWESWVTLDLDGDRRPDLVSTNKAYENEVLAVFGFGSMPHWRFYRNTGAGFAPAAVWQLPTAGGIPGATFPLITHSAQVRDHESWSLFDIDGDGRSDLVSTNHAVDEPTGGVLRVFGFPSNPHWRIYKNTGDRFAAAVEWSLPAAGGATNGAGFPLRDYAAQFIGDESWSMRDIDGDGRSDLVSTNQAVIDGDIGALRVFGHATASPHWRVYLNQP
ncbi:MAG: FG-GAP repeat domain-containing protein [Kofleriaceae bacterium]